MQHFFKFKGKAILLDTAEILKMCQQALTSNPFSRSERLQIAGLLQPMIYKICRVMMTEFEKPQEKELGEPQPVNDRFEQILFQRSLSGEYLQDVMNALRQEEGIDMAKLVTEDLSGYVSFHLSGPIHVLYDLSELVRVRAVILAEKKLEKTLIETPE